MEGNLESKHPIERLMSSTLVRLRELADTDTVVGSPMTTPDGAVIVPVSKVSMGFLGGGGEYDTIKKKDDQSFAAGSGAGVSVLPIGFLVGKNGHYEMVGFEKESAYGKLFDKIPEFVLGLLNHDKSKN